MSQKNKKGRPLKGKEPRVNISLRIEPKVKDILIKRYGSMQKAFDQLIKVVGAQ